MSMTFTKLFSSITESTVWCEPDHVRLVWITMLAMADRRGRVWASIPGLANRARVPVESCREAIDRFLAPDPDSRTELYEGRRIETIDGGWRLLNYSKYREIRDEEAAKESKRRYAAEQRASRKSRTESNTDEHGRDNAEAEAEAIKTKDNGQQADRFPEFWRGYPKKVKKQDAQKVWKSRRLDTKADEIIQDVKDRLAEDGRWLNGFVPDPPTYLRGSRWEDEFTEVIRK